MPQLGPRSLRLFTILWLPALLLAVAAPVVGNYYSYQRAAEPMWLRLGLLVDSEGLRILNLASAEARSSGLAIGDRIVAIDGRAVPPNGYDRVRPWLERPEGATIVFTVQSGAGPPRDVRLTRRAGNGVELFEGTGFTWRSQFVVIAAARLLPALALVAASILLFRQRRDRVAALLSLALLLIASTLFGTGFWDVHAPWWLESLVGTAGWTALALVFLVFPSGEFVPRWTLLPALALLPWLAINGLELLPLNAGNVGTVLFLGVGLAALAARYRGLAHGAQKQQLRWVFLGFAYGTAAIAFVVVLIATQVELIAADLRFAVWLPMLFFLVGGAGVVAYAAGLLVSMLRYRLYDADAAISRSAGYAVLTLGFVAIFTASEKVLELFAARYFQEATGALSGAIAAAFAALLVPPMHKRVHAWAERRFQKQLLHLRRDLPKCVDDLRETSDLKDLLDEVLARVERGTRAIRSAVEIEGRIAASRGGGEDFELAVPLQIAHQEKEIGTLLVGPRPDGSRPGRDEREALHEIADPVARAIQIVRLREARDDAMERALTDLSQRLTALEGSRTPES